MRYAAPVITPTDIETFTEGDCHILARAIHRISGWAIGTFVTIFEGQLQPTLHVFVLTPEGFALDVEGHHDLDAFCDRWCLECYSSMRTPYHRWGTAENLWEAAERGGYWDMSVQFPERNSEARAARLAPFILSTYHGKVRTPCPR